MPWKTPKPWAFFPFFWRKWSNSHQLQRQSEHTFYFLHEHAGFRAAGNKNFFKKSNPLPIFPAKSRLRWGTADKTRLSSPDFWGQVPRQSCFRAAKKLPQGELFFLKVSRQWTISACWTSRAWCHPCQTSGHFFAFSLVFGLILRFFYTSDSNFYPRAWRTKSRFCSLCVPCVSLPRATQDNSRERNLVAVLVIT